MLKLVEEFGSKDNLQEAQNFSPTVAEFLALDETYPTITFNGYIIKKPRSDYRVTLEGFEVTALNADQALELVRDHRYADDLSVTRQDDAAYTVYCWWD